MMKAVSYACQDGQTNSAARCGAAENPDEQNEAGMLAKAFGLTPADTRVLASLLAGRTLAATATALGVAATTVRRTSANLP
jgi:FixJ family two-component response regulator